MIQIAPHLGAGADHVMRAAAAAAIAAASQKARPLLHVSSTRAHACARSCVSVSISRAPGTDKLVTTEP
jgi:hypothetical protein